VDKRGEIANDRRKIGAKRVCVGVGDASLMYCATDHDPHQSTPSQFLRKIKRSATHAALGAPLEQAWRQPNPAGPTHIPTPACRCFSCVLLMREATVDHLAHCPRTFFVSYRVHLTTSPKKKTRLVLSQPSPAANDDALPR